MLGSEINIAHGRKCPVKLINSSIDFQTCLLVSLVVMHSIRVDRPASLAFLTSGFLVKRQVRFPSRELIQTVRQSVEFIFQHMVRKKREKARLGVGCSKPGHLAVPTIHWPFDLCFHGVLPWARTMASSAVHMECSVAC